MSQDVIAFSSTAQVLIPREDPVVLFIRTRRKASTRAAYHAEIAQFRQWIKLSLVSVALSELQSYYDYLRDERELAPATQLRKLSALRALYTFLHEQGHIMVNPALGLLMPKKARVRQPRALTLQEINALLGSHPAKGRNWQA
jgi:integrase/recombinase XerD